MGKKFAVYYIHIMEKMFLLIHFFLFLTGGRTERQIRKVSGMNPKLKQTNKQTGIPLIKTNKLTNRYITSAFDSFLYNNFVT